MEKRSTPSLQIIDRFGAQTAFASLRLPDGTEATVPAEHAAAIYVNEQPAFRVVCTPALLPQLAGMGADPDRRHARRSAAVPRHPGGAQLLCAAQRGNCFCL